MILTRILYCRPFFSRFSLLSCFFLTLSLPFVSTDQSYKRVSPVAASFRGILYRKLAINFRSLLRISKWGPDLWSRARTFSLLTDTERHRPRQKFRIAKKQSLADLSPDLFSNAKSIGKSGIAVVPKVSSSLPRNNATSNSSCI